MYACLKVTLETGEELRAWRIEKLSISRVRIQLDKQDGTGKYPDPAGSKDVNASDLHTIEADF